MFKKIIIIASLLASNVQALRIEFKNEVSPVLLQKKAMHLRLETLNSDVSLFLRHKELIIKKLQKSEEVFLSINHFQSIIPCEIINMKYVIVYCKNPTSAEKIDLALFFERLLEEKKDTKTIIETLKNICSFKVISGLAILGLIGIGSSKIKPFRVQSWAPSSFDGRNIKQAQMRATNGSSLIGRDEVISFPSVGEAGVKKQRIFDLLTKNFKKDSLIEVFTTPPGGLANARKHYSTMIAKNMKTALKNDLVFNQDHFKVCREDVGDSGSSVATATFLASPLKDRCYDDKFFSSRERQAAEIPGIIDFLGLYNKDFCFAKGFTRFGRIKLSSSQFAQAPLDSIERNIEIFDLPQKNNIFNMPLLKKNQATGKKHDGKELLSGALLPFLIVNSYAKDDELLTIETGLWGVEEGISPLASLAAQYLAVILTNVTNKEMNRRLKLHVYSLEDQVEVYSDGKNKSLDIESVSEQALKIAQSVFNDIQKDANTFSPSSNGVDFISVAEERFDLILQERKIFSIGCP